jgi:hypothetical protein
LIKYTWYKPGDQERIFLDFLYIRFILNFLITGIRYLTKNHKNTQRVVKQVVQQVDKTVAQVVVKYVTSETKLKLLFSTPITRNYIL